VDFNRILYRIGDLRLIGISGDEGYGIQATTLQCALFSTESFQLSIGVGYRSQDSISCPIFEHENNFKHDTINSLQLTAAVSFRTKS
jgi:hypothetical protein